MFSYTFIRTTHTAVQTLNCLLSYLHSIPPPPVTGMQSITVDTSTPPCSSSLLRCSIFLRFLSGVNFIDRMSALFEGLISWWGFPNSPAAMCNLSVKQDSIVRPFCSCIVYLMVPCHVSLDSCNAFVICIIWVICTGALCRCLKPTTPIYYWG